jgi:hypothetical protein
MGHKHSSGACTTGTWLSDVKGDLFRQENASRARSLWVSRSHCVLAKLTSRDQILVLYTNS